MKMSRCTVLVFLMLVICNGCVTRTTRGHSRQDNTGKNGKIIEKKTIWFWQEDFRQP